MNENEKIQVIRQLINTEHETDKLPLRFRTGDEKRYEVIQFPEREFQLLKDFQSFLSRNKYIEEDTFESMFVYLFNLGISLHKTVTLDEIKKEAQTG